MLHGIITRLVIVGVIVACGFALEEFSARRPSLPRSLWFNLRWTVCYQASYFVLWTGLTAFTIRTASALPGAGVIAFRPSTWPAFLGSAVLWMALRDLGYYAMHRAQHASRWLWAEHEIHHSDESMNVTTASRHHWLEQPLTCLFVLAPVAYLVRFPFSAAFIVSLATDLLGHFIHLDAPIGTGRISRWIATPALHRVHHSRAPEHRDKNFAAICPLWDVLFGTYHAPQKDEPPATGLSSGERITTVWQAATWPLTRWWGMFTARGLSAPASQAGVSPRSQQPTTQGRAAVLRIDHP